MIICCTFFHNLLAQQSDNRNTTYLPVVIHILHSEEEQNISNDQIIQQLETLNKDFSQNNDNFDSTPQVFQNVAANTDLQFCLANRDPQGNETSGITRTETFVSEIGLSELYFLTDEGGINAWDNSRYINIWVADMGDSGILGSTPIPGDGSPSAKDGILVNYRFFGVEGDHQDINRNQGKVLTHEMGHYLGLLHVWGTLNTNCSDDDGIDDTPLQDGPNFGCPTFPSPDICTQGNGVMFHNFMDFSDDDCLSMFTQGQKELMHQTLEEFRPELMENADMNCIVSTAENELPSFEIYPNPTNEFVFIKFEREELNRRIQLFDIKGRIVKDWVGTQREGPYFIEDLPAGIYYLVVAQSVQKVIVY